MEWTVRITGPEKLLKALTVLTHGMEVTVSRSGGRYVLASAGFCGLSDHRDVHSIASRYLRLFNSLVGVGAIRGISYAAPLRLLEIVKAEDGKTVRWDYEVAVSSIGIGEVDAPASAQRVQQLINSAEASQSVSHALELLGTGDDWANLYRVYEVIRHDVGGDKAMARKDWANKKNLKLFEHTANSPKAIGLAARHGVPKGEPPGQPMEHCDARSLVVTLLNRWLDDKLILASKGPGDSGRPG